MSDFTKITIEFPSVKKQQTLIHEFELLETLRDVKQFITQNATKAPAQFVLKGTVPEKHFGIGDLALTLGELQFPPEAVISVHSLDEYLAGEGMQNVSLNEESVNKGWAHWPRCEGLLWLCRCCSKTEDDLDDPEDPVSRSQSKMDTIIDADTDAQYHKQRAADADVEEGTVSIPFPGVPYHDEVSPPHVVSKGYKTTTTTTTITSSSAAAPSPTEEKDDQDYYSAEEDDDDHDDDEAQVDIEEVSKDKLKRTGSLDKGDTPRRRRKVDQQKRKSTDAHDHDDDIEHADVQQNQDVADKGEESDVGEEEVDGSEGGDTSEDMMDVDLGGKSKAD